MSSAVQSLIQLTSESTDLYYGNRFIQMTHSEHQKEVWVPQSTGPTCHPQSDLLLRASSTKQIMAPRPAYLLLIRLAKCRSGPIIYKYFVGPIIQSTAAVVNKIVQQSSRRAGTHLLTDRLRTYEKKNDFRILQRRPYGLSSVYNPSLLP